MKILFYVLAFCFLQVELSAQNLVLNPSFEDNSFNCTDTTYNASGTCLHWSGVNSNYGFPCKTRAYNPPREKYYGYQYPRTGVACCGGLNFYNFSDSGDNLRHYVQGMFVSPLIKDSFYKVSFYVSLCEKEFESPACAISSVGAYLSKDSFTKSILNVGSGLVPQIQNPLGRFLDDTLGWMKVSGVMKADGGERFILISNFLSGSQTPVKPLYGEKGWQAAYFLDDVSVEPIHAPNLGNDTILCSGSIILLNPNVDNADSVFWQDGSRADNFLVTKPGKYWVEAWYEGYNISDTIYIMPGYEVNLGADQKLCEGETYTFTLPEDGAKYEWPDGSTKNTFTINQSGKYWVKATKDDCTAYDTAEIIFQQPLSASQLPQDTFLCQGKNLTIDLQYLNADVKWQDGSTSNQYQIDKEGTYMLTLKNACGSLQHSFHVTEKYCDCNIHIPNAFTPNSDAVNDGFNITSDCVFSSYNLSVYNRWGVQIFSTDDSTQSWDGNFKGKPCTQDVYFYTLKAVADNGESFSQRRMFKLVK